MRSLKSQSFLAVSIELYNRFTLNSVKNLAACSLRTIPSGLNDEAVLYLVMFFQYIQETASTNSSS